MDPATVALVEWAKTLGPTGLGIIVVYLICRRAVDIIGRWMQANQARIEVQQTTFDSYRADREKEFREERDRLMDEIRQERERSHNTILGLLANNKAEMRAMTDALKAQTDALLGMKEAVAEIGNNLNDHAATVAGFPGQLESIKGILRGADRV